MPITITDPTDERLRDFVGLTDVKLRRVLEPAGGLYLAESGDDLRGEDVLIGAWVVLRGLSYIGDAMSHAVLPGIVAWAEGGRGLTGRATVVTLGVLKAPVARCTGSQSRA